MRQSIIGEELPHRVGLYVRVSTVGKGQTTQNQLNALHEVAQRSGWTIVQTFEDHVSGSKGRAARPGYAALLKAIARREIDVVAAWDASRLSRSLIEFLNFLRELEARKIDLYLHQQGIDTSTPAGRALMQMMGVFSELERGIIQERIRAGIDRARQEGKRLGRPVIEYGKRRKIEALLRQGTGIQKTARTVGCGVSVVQRIRNELRTR